MKLTLKIMSWAGLVTGLFAIIGWAQDTSDGFALVGGLWFIAWGILSFGEFA